VVRREFGWASRQYVVSVYSVLHTAHEHQLIRVQMYKDDITVFSSSAFSSWVGGGWKMLRGAVGEGGERRPDIYTAGGGRGRGRG
jgi:hypothetical protein